MFNEHCQFSSCKTWGGARETHSLFQWRLLLWQIGNTQLCTQLSTLGLRPCRNIHSTFIEHLSIKVCLNTSYSLMLYSIRHPPSQILCSCKYPPGNMSLHECLVNIFFSAKMNHLSTKLFVP